MKFLLDLFRHNAWANSLVFAAFESAGPAMIDTTGYDGDPLRERLRHLAVVERAFLETLRAHLQGAAAPEEPEGPSDITSLNAYIAENAGGFEALLASSNEEQLASPVFVPWWEREFTGEEMLAQVLAHSGQHRAELAWELARAGIDTGALDFIVWAARGRPVPLQVGPGAQG